MEAQELLMQIDVLRKLFPEKPEGLKAKQVQQDSKSLIYLCRFPSEQDQPTEDKRKKKTAQHVQMMQIAAGADLSATKSAQHMVSAQTKEKKRQYAMSLTTLAADPTKRYKLVADGAIDMLLELATIDDGMIHRSVAAAFSYLAGEPRNRNEMIDGGCILAMFNLSSSPSATIQSDIARAVCNLCNSSGSESRAIRDGATVIASHIASSIPDKDIVTICITVALNLSCVSERYTKLEDIHDAILAMNTLPLDEEQDKILLQALCNLSAIRGNQLRLIEDGVMRIVERLIVSPNAELRALTSEVACNLTSDQKSRSKILEHNMLKIMRNMSKDSSEYVRTACIQCYYNLSRDLFSREKMMAAGSIPVIIKISMEKVSYVVAKLGAKTLRSLCGDVSIASYLVKEGVMRALTSLAEVEDGVTRQFVAEALCSLFKSGKVLPKLIEQGAVGLVVSLSQKLENPITGEWCAFALYHLSNSGLCPGPMLLNGVLPCLVKLCIDSTVATKHYCTNAFSCITQLKSVDCTSAIPILVHMLRHETEHSIKAESASALYNLADDNSSCNLMLAAGALMPIVRLTQSEFMLTKIKCAAILSRLSLHEEYFSQFGRDDVLQVLLELASVDHILTQRRVVIAISNLSQSPELRKMLLGLHTTPEKIKMLISKPDENLRRGCTAIICNLSYEEGSGKEMMDAKIVPKILVTAVVTSDQIETKLICVKALLNIMSDPSLHKDMVEQDVIWGLSTLAQVQNEEILVLCSRAICSISTQFAKEMLSSMAVIKIVMKLINWDDFELIRLGAITLTNLLLQSTNEHEVFRKVAVENMGKLVMNTDEEISEMCVLCLCFASQSESCRSSIISAGLLQHIDSSNIFAEPRVSYAYLAMFENIANNPAMRSKLLDDHLVKRFSEVCKSHDNSLNLAVANALYSVSCDNMNIVKLTEQNVLSVLDTLWEMEVQSPSEHKTKLTHHIVAVVYNLSTNDSVSAKVVSQGIVKLMKKLWPVTLTEFKYMELIYLSIAQLACQFVNTVQMINDGGNEILCYLSKMPRIQNELSGEVICRLAAGLRNMLCIFTSHVQLVDDGCVETLVMIAKMTKLPQAKEDASVALRSLTYNSSLRDKLVSTGAIGIMLEDINRAMRGEFTHVNKDLLSALESESWGNGARGCIKEGRSTYLQPIPLFLDLLRGSTRITVNFDAKTAQLEKYLVNVELYEPPIEHEAQSHSNTIDTKELANFVDPNEMFEVFPMTKKRRDCDIQEHSILALKRNVAAFPVDDDDSADEDETRPRANSYESPDSPTNLLPALAAAVAKAEKAQTDKPKKSKSTSSLPKVVKKSSGAEKNSFDELVQIINRSKRANGAYIKDVVTKWNEVSNF